MILQNRLAGFRQAVSAIERYDQEVRLGLVDRGFDSGFFLDLANNLDVRLVRDSFNYESRIRRGLLATRTLLAFVRVFSALAQASANLCRDYRFTIVSCGSTGALRGLDGFQGNLLLMGTGTYPI